MKHSYTRESFPPQTRVHAPIRRIDGDQRDVHAVHTPGPWSIKDTRTLLRTDKECDYGRKAIDDPEVEANARLIAAAPDMLAALIKIVSAAEHMGDEDAPVVVQGRAAIAKAEGRL